MLAISIPAPICREDSLSMMTEHMTVDQPKHPPHAMTTYELRDYRHQLERAIAFLNSKDPIPAVRDDLRAKLEAVLAEQDERMRLAHA
jgi:hypothetical protein